MKEEFIQFAWLYKTYLQAELITDTKETIEVIDPGQMNHNGGPDFFNAKVKIDGTLWVGNIEVHTYSNDWYKHKHHTDKKYNNVILHVVHTYNKTVYNHNGKLIPTLEINIPDTVIKTYNNLLMQATTIPCGNKLGKINEIYLNHWMTRLFYEKLENKHAYVSKLLNENNNNWEAVFYALLFKSFGLNVNKQPFELLYRSIPFNLILKYSTDKQKLDALLFGQAGFFTEADNDHQYFNSLSKEYQYLAKIHNLKPLDKHLWKFMRLRPNNFPTLRLAQLSTLIYNSKLSFSSLLETNSVTDLYKLLDCTADDYWQTHFTFNKKSNNTSGEKLMGKTMKNLIILNCIIPLRFSYGRILNIEHHIDKVMNWLEDMKPEKNHIISKWQGYNYVPENAFQSQALIYLYNQYCLTRKCLYCKIGHLILTKHNETG